MRILEFPDLLRLIDDRADTFRAVVHAAPDLDAPVPTCPEWTLRNLVHHLGDVHRRWAANVHAGPADQPAPHDDEPAPPDRDALLAWSATSTRQLLDALRAAGPDRGCWTWWGMSESPQTAGAVARHQVLEATVHTYDAQLTAGAARPLPDAAALDGVEDFLSTCCSGPDPWPHRPAVVDFHTTEGRSWRLRLSTDGAWSTRLPTDTDERPDVTATGPAADLVLVFYDRIPIDSLRVDGDVHILEQLRDWDV